MDIFHALKVAANGRKEVDETWVAPSSLRPVIMADACQIWLKHFGNRFGFEKDETEGTLFEYITNQGQFFEGKFISELAPDAITASESDVAVRKYASLNRTVELMAQRVPVITKAAVWNDKLGVYGSCDMIALGSTLRRRFPDLSPYIDAADGEARYYVLDMKNQRGLDKPKSAIKLQLASTQIDIYTRALGEMQGDLAPYAFLVTPDRIFSPLPVAVHGKLGDPLPRQVVGMIALHNHIKQEGGQYRPWRDQIVAPNWSNRDGSWNTAKQRILSEYMEYRPLELLPGVGAVQAEALRAAGFNTSRDLFSKNARHFDFGAVKGFGDSKARTLHAVLDANREDHKHVPNVPADCVPPPCEVALFVDFEFITGIRVDIEKTWPTLRGKELLFMIGCGWEDKGKWQFKKFCAADDTPAAEKKMLEEYIAFLRDKGVIVGSGKDTRVCPDGHAAMYHYSPAEIGASKRAAARTGLDILVGLPWVDLLKPFKAGPIILPGQWDFSIKSVSKALSAYAPEFATAYPKNLSAGADAMALAIRAYDRGGDVVGSDEFATIAAYLEIDCENLYQILRWLRASARDDSDSSSPRGIKGTATASAYTGGWYRLSKALMAGERHTLCETRPPSRAE